jgi:hypothetical protein
LLRKYDGKEPQPGDDAISAQAFYRAVIVPDCASYQALLASAIRAAKLR